MFMIFDQGKKTSAKNDAPISRPFWIFELSLIVFDFWAFKYYK